MLEFIKHWFKDAESNKPANMSLIGTDVHSHLIPGIDDGAPTLEASIELIIGLEALGYKHFITTPHIMSDYYTNTPSVILSGLKKVRKGIEELGLQVKIHAAAEYMLDSIFAKMVDNDEQLLTLHNKDILVELPFAGMPPNADEVFFKLQTKGYRVILAHPERYSYMQQDKSEYEDLVDRNIKLQVNLNSFTGAYGPHVKKTAEELVKHDLVSALGTDCHHLQHIDMAHQAVKSPFLHQLIEKKNLLNHEWEQAFQRGEIG